MAGENLVRPKGFKATVENFWYHYKFHTIVCAIIVITLVVSVAQCCTKTQYDYKIVLATRGIPFTTTQITDLTNELTPYGTDLNGDGEVNIMLVDCTLSGDSTDHQNNLAKQSKLQALLMSDTEVMMFITDKAAFEWIKGLNDEGFIENLSLPDGDGYYYDLTNTKIVQNAMSNSSFSWPKELLLSRRIIKGTLFEQRDGIETSIKNADEFIERVINETNK